MPIGTNPLKCKRYRKMKHPIGTLFECQECGKKYKQISSLHRHIKKTHSGINTRKHRCSYCDSSFHSKYQLDVHKFRISAPFVSSASCNHCSQSNICTLSTQSHSHRRAALSVHVESSPPLHHSICLLCRVSGCTYFMHALFRFTIEII